MKLDTHRDRPATWLEIVRSARQASHRVALHRLPGGERLAVTLHDRVLCSSDGRITVFDDLAAAERFLTLAGVRGWRFGASLSGLGEDTQPAEHLRMRNGKLVS